MTFIKTIALLGSATIGLAGYAYVSHAQTAGITAAIRNSAQLKTSADRGLRKAVLKERISLNDEIATGAASVMQILLLDKTTFTLGANARMTIDRFVFDPARSASAVGASITKGAFRFMSGRATRNAPGQTQLRTPVASIGVRGTIVEGVVGLDALRIARGEAGMAGITGSNDSATLIVLRGPGQATQGDEKPGAIDVSMDGRTVALEQPGVALFIPGPNAAPVGPFQLSDAGLDAIHQLLRTSPDKSARQAELFAESSPITDMILECEGGFGDPFQNSVSSSSSSGCFSD